MGPKPTTVVNFWRMIWQEKPPVILMLTGLVEQGNPKVYHTTESCNSNCNMNCNLDATWPLAWAGGA